jgi:hypothetical protein
MHSAMFVFEKPKTATAHADMNWRSLVEAIRHTTKNRTDIDMISENCVLIPLQNGLSLFVALGELARSGGYEYRTHFFPEAPVWLHSS